MNQKSVVTILVVIVILLLGVIGYFALADREDSNNIDIGVENGEEGNNEADIEEDIKTEIEKILAQGALPNPSLEMPKNVKILSVDVDGNKVTFNFSKEVVSGGRAVFEEIFKLASNAAHPFVQGTGPEPKYGELNLVVLVEGKADFEDIFNENNSNVIVPPAPGPFVADAVRNLMPKSLKVGENTITAEVRGYMFFEAETQLKLYDGNTEVNIGTRPDGLPNTVVTAQGQWMTTGYVPVSQKITIPASLKGKTLVIRFIVNDPSDNARPRYWGTLIKVE